MAQADIELGQGLKIPAAELRQLASRSSGPGGQHVNKSATRVTLRWNLRSSQALDETRRQRLLERLASRLTAGGELIVHAEASRSRARNLDAARERMADLVADALEVPLSRRPTRPSRASRVRQQKAKRQRSDLKRSRRDRGDSEERS